MGPKVQASRTLSQDVAIRARLLRLLARRGWVRDDKSIEHSQDSISNKYIFRLPYEGPKGSRRAVAIFLPEKIDRKFMLSWRQKLLTKKTCFLVIIAEKVSKECYLENCQRIWPRVQVIPTAYLLNDPPLAFVVTPRAALDHAFEDDKSNVTRNLPLILPHDYGTLAAGAMLQDCVAVTAAAGKTTCRLLVSDA
jgi:hypothetical protein